MRSERCEILIVGAGPVGLFLALLLQHQGIGATVVERQKAAYPLPRAVLFDHESRRLFGSVNLSKQVEAVLESVVGAGGEHGTNFVWRDADLKRESTVNWTATGFMLIRSAQSSSICSQKLLRDLVSHRFKAFLSPSWKVCWRRQYWNVVFG